MVREDVNKVLRLVLRLGRFYERCGQLIVWQCALRSRDRDNSLVMMMCGVAERTELG